MGNERPLESSHQIILVGDKLCPLLTLYKNIITKGVFIFNIRQCTDLKELTPSIVNKLITKIEIFDRVTDEDGKKHVPIKIHFVDVGIMQFPDAEMLEKAKEEMKANAKKAS